MVELKIDSRDLDYTIDTYATFTRDNAIESEVEHYREELNNEELTYDDFDWNFHNEEYLKHLAECSIDVLKNNLINTSYLDRDGIVLGIELVNTKSPQFYNYTTDSYSAIWSVDEDKLKAFIATKQKEFDAWLAEEWSSLSHDIKYDEQYDEENLLVAMVNYFASDTFSSDNYIDEMYEAINDYEFTEATLITKESE